MKKNYIEIRAKLQTLGLQVLIDEEEIAEEDIGNYKENMIISQSVEAGEKLSVGDTITLTIPKFDNKYPNFYEEGYTVDEVKSFAEEMGVDLTVQEVETNEYSEGTIFYQSREAGSTVVKGASLRIRVAITPSANDSDDTNTELE